MIAGAGPARHGNGLGGRTTVAFHRKTVPLSSGPKRSPQGARGRDRRTLVVGHDRGAIVDPDPEPVGIVVSQTETAVAAGVAEVARPVVVVQGGAVAGEILGKEHVLDVVATRGVPRDAEPLAAHRVVRDPSHDAERANGGRPFRDAVYR